MNILEVVKKFFFEKIQKLPYGTEVELSMDKIIIKEKFKRTRPAHEKQLRSDSFYLKHGYVDRPIEVNVIKYKKDNSIKYVLVDNYTRYITLRRFDVDFAPIRIADIKVVE